MEFRPDVIPDSPIATMLSHRALAGAGLASFTALMGGASVVLTRYLMPESDPFSLPMARYGIGALLLASSVLLFARLRPVAPSDWPGIIGLAIVFYAAFPYFFAKGLEFTPAARGAIVYTTMPLMALTIGSLTGLERMTIRKVIAVFIAFSGVVITLSDQVSTIAPDAWIGDILMALAALCSASYVLLSRRFVARYGGLQLTAWSMLIGSLFMVPLAFAFGEPLGGSLDFQGDSLIVFLLLAIPGATIMVFVYVIAIGMTTATGVTMTVGFNPLSAMVLGSLILGEPVTTKVIIGFLCITCAVILANIEFEAAPEPLAPDLANTDA